MLKLKLEEDGKVLWEIPLQVRAWDRSSLHRELDEVERETARFEATFNALANHGRMRMMRMLFRDMERPKGFTEFMNELGMNPKIVSDSTKRLRICTRTSASAASPNSSGPSNLASRIRPMTESSAMPPASTADQNAEVATSLLLAAAGPCWSSSVAVTAHSPRVPWHGPSPAGRRAPPGPPASRRVTRTPGATARVVSCGRRADPA